MAQRRMNRHENCLVAKFRLVNNLRIVFSFDSVIFEASSEKKTPIASFFYVDCFNLCKVGFICVQQPCFQYMSPV
jgi:hypothetical protein